MLFCLKTVLTCISTPCFVLALICQCIALILALVFFVLCFCSCSCLFSLHIDGLFASSLRARQQMISFVSFVLPLPLYRCFRVHATTMLPRDSSLTRAFPAGRRAGDGAEPRPRQSEAACLYRRVPPRPLHRGCLGHEGEYGTFASAPHLHPFSYPFSYPFHTISPLSGGFVFVCGKCLFACGVCVDRLCCPSPLTTCH